MPPPKCFLPIFWNTPLTQTMQGWCRQHKATGMMLLLPQSLVFCGVQGVLGPVWDLQTAQSSDLSTGFNPLGGREGNPFRHYLWASWDLPHLLVPQCHQAHMWVTALCNKTKRKVIPAGFGMDWTKQCHTVAGQSTSTASSTHELF